MLIRQFEDIIAWQNSKILALHIYQAFKYNKDFFYKDQIQRTVTSIMNNIAEGFERKGNKEFKKFLFIAKGSCAEVRSMLYLARELNYISEIQFNNLKGEALTISKHLSGLIKTLD